MSCKLWRLGTSILRLIPKVKVDRPNRSCSKTGKMSGIRPDHHPDHNWDAFLLWVCMEDFLVLPQEVVRCERFGVDALSRFVWRRLPVFSKGEKVEFFGSRFCKSGPDNLYNTTMVQAFNLKLWCDSLWCMLNAIAGKGNDDRCFKPLISSWARCLSSLRTWSKVFVHKFCFSSSSKPNKLSRWEIGQQNNFID